MDRNAIMSGGRLAVFSSWCRARGMTWLPGSGAAALVLRPQRRADGDALMIAQREGELRLLSRSGDVLAAASDLPALLDAIDAGVAAGAGLAA
jgi:hypothetical protein